MPNDPTDSVTLIQEVISVFWAQADKHQKDSLENFAVRKLDDKPVIEITDKQQEITDKQQANKNPGGMLGITGLLKSIFKNYYEIEAEIHPHSELNILRLKERDVLLNAEKIQVTNQVLEEYFRENSKVFITNHKKNETTEGRAPDLELIKQRVADQLKRKSASPSSSLCGLSKEGALQQPAQHSIRLGGGDTVGYYDNFAFDDDD
ncbi:hypothetical protein RLOatenuis_7670 [Rickettsiales bacterium]|nr:hypothetical protein RLOatenuis_7670 [Rickettsiales bacterium]